jgi:hypothetical protein
MEYDFDGNGTVDHDSFLPDVTDKSSRLASRHESAIAESQDTAQRNFHAPNVNAASTRAVTNNMLGPDRVAIDMASAARGAAIVARLAARGASRSHKLDLLDDLREFRHELERAEWALEAAQAAVIDAQADVANALFACEEAGCVDIAGEPLEEFC